MVGEEAVAAEVEVLPWGEEVGEERHLCLRHPGFLLFLSHLDLSAEL